MLQKRKRAHHGCHDGRRDGTREAGCLPAVALARMHAGTASMPGCWQRWTEPLRTWRLVPWGRRSTCLIFWIVRPEGICRLCGSRTWHAVVSMGLKSCMRRRSSGGRAGFCAGKLLCVQHVWTEDLLPAERPRDRGSRRTDISNLNAASIYICADKQAIYSRDNYEVDTGIALSCLQRSACANMQRMEKTTTYRMRCMQGPGLL